MCCDAVTSHPTVVTSDALVIDKAVDLDFIIGREILDTNIFNITVMHTIAIRTMLAGKEHENIAGRTVPK